MILILAEKPSAKRNFAKALGGSSGSYSGMQYKICALRGHVMGLLPPDRQVPADKSEAMLKWSLADLPWDLSQFSWKKGVLKGCSDVISELKRELSGVDEVCIATDVDPSGEGELLAWEALEKCGWNGKTSRMYFTDEAPASVQKAFGGRKALGAMEEDGDFVKAHVRERWDLASMQFVRAASCIAHDHGFRTVVRENYIPDDQRIITVEDTAELNLAKTHVLSLQSRPANNEGKGEITLQQLVINTLRQRPDRIVVGECRGPEAFDMLQAMNSGHDGSLTTTHANNPRAALDRLQNLVQMSRAGANMPPDAIMKIITEAVDFVVEIKRLPDGSRRVNNICEVCGMQGNVPTIGSIMKFQKTGVDGNGRIMGEFRPTGSRIVSEEHKERFYSNGIEIKPEWFDNGGLW